MCVGIACSRNLKKIYIPKFQRSKLSKFITNLPLRHVVTSTYSFFVGIIGTFYEPCVILQICLNIKTWWWFFILLKDYKTTSVLMPFILAGQWWDIVIRSLSNLSSADSPSFFLSVVTQFIYVFFGLPCDCFPFTSTCRTCLYHCKQIWTISSSIVLSVPTLWCRTKLGALSARLVAHIILIKRRSFLLDLTSSAKDNYQVSEQCGRTDCIQHLKIFFLCFSERTFLPFYTPLNSWNFPQALPTLSLSALAPPPLEFNISPR